MDRHIHYNILGLFETNTVWYFSTQEKYSDGLYKHLSFINGNPPRIDNNHQVLIIVKNVYKLFIKLLTIPRP